MSEWQPIESAPKDGTLIRVAGKNLGNPRGTTNWHQFDARWRDRDNYSEACWATVDCRRLDFLTHWMPLPAPPTA